MRIVNYNNTAFTTEVPEQYVGKPTIGAQLWLVGGHAKALVGREQELFEVVSIVCHTPGTMTVFVRVSGDLVARRFFEGRS